FQNAIEDRPGRGAMSSKQAAQWLREEARRGSLDGEAGAAGRGGGGGGGGGHKRTYVAGGGAGGGWGGGAGGARGGKKERGAELGLSPKTVDNHIQSIYSKLGVKTRGGATLFALEHGLLQPGRNDVAKT